MEMNRLVMVAMAALWSGASFAGAEGLTSTIYGTGAGAATSLSAENTELRALAAEVRRLRARWFSTPPWRLP